MPFVAGCPWLVPLNVDPEENREQWLAERLGGVGGSDVAAVVGESKQKRAIDVWLERATGVFDESDNDRTRVGRMLEGVILNWFAEGAPHWPRAGDPLITLKPPTVYHRDRPWQRGSCDALVYEIADDAIEWTIHHRPHAIGEVKTHGWFMGRKYDTEDDGVVIDVPVDKRIQCQWYMELFDVDTCYLIALIDTHIRKTYVLHRDRELAATLLEEVERFWTRHVVTGIEPPSDGSEAYRKYLHKRFADHDATILPATAELLETIEHAKKLRSDIKFKSIALEYHEHTIKKAIGSAGGVRYGIKAVEWRTERSGKYRDKEMRIALYHRLGMTDTEIAEFEAKFAMPNVRRLRIP